MRRKRQEADEGEVASAGGAVMARRQAVVHAISGGLAAGGVRAALLPLDTCKTRLQLAGANAGQSLRVTLLRNGGFFGLYRGCIPAVAGILPAAALYMGLYSTLRRVLTARLPRKLRTVGVATSAGIADLCATLVRVPCERLKQQLQAGMHSNIIAAVRHKDTLKYMYGGLGAQLARDVPYAASNWVIYEKFRRSGASPLESFGVGAIAGSVAAFVTNPMDVVKTRLMTQRSAVVTGGAGTVNAKLYRGVWSTLNRVVKEEGPSALYRGLAPRIAAKMLQSALFFAAYEGVRARLSKMLEVKKRGVYSGV